MSIHPDLSFYTTSIAPNFHSLSLELLHGQYMDKIIKILDHGPNQYINTDFKILLKKNY